mgnify:CR=1 FL=1
MLIILSREREDDDDDGRIVIASKQYTVPLCLGVRDPGIADVFWLSLSLYGRTNIGKTIQREVAPLELRPPGREKRTLIQPVVFRVVTARVVAARAVAARAVTARVAAARVAAAQPELVRTQHCRVRQ